jgi:hypothetical protein
MKRGGNPMAKIDRHSGRIILVLLTLFSFLGTSSAWADPQKMIAAIDGNSGNYRVVSQKIFDFKELGQQEFKSSQLLPALVNSRIRAVLLRFQFRLSTCIFFQSQYNT